MAITALNPENWRPMVQDFLNNQLVVKPISRTEFRSELTDGDVIHWPYVSTVRVQDYTTYTDVTVDAGNAVDESMNIDQSRVATFKIDQVDKKQMKDKGFPAKMAREAAYALANDIDQKVLKEGTDNANNSVTGGTLTVSNLYSKMTDAKAELVRAKGADGRLFAVLDPERIALLSQTFVANGFDEADNSLRNGFKGRAAGFDIYESNNLATSVGLTVDTQPTATDTFTIAGVTWTCVADGAAASAGEINVGADLADFQAIFVKAINGTTSTDYVDVSTENRRKLQAAGVSAGAFATNVSTITGYGKLNGSETFTAATNIFGTETSNLLTGKVGAMSLAMQMMPELYVTQEPKQLVKNYITHTLFGKKVFYRDADRLCKITINV